MRLISKLFMVFSIALATAAGAPAAADDDAGWIADKNGCKVGNPVPQPNESITWTGPCKDGLADGEGVLTFFVSGTPHSRYEGVLRQGWAEGRGKLELPDGSRYEGEWQQSMEHGMGRREWSDGSSYDGQWKNGKPHGSGQYRLPDGRLLMGTWNEGVFEGDEGAPAPEQEQPHDPNRT
jgi:hypothetical protein